jgi:hypothetical protein
MVESTWVGGLFADGAKMNDFAHQNYFVGYGTTPGFPRTAERRSFFWFDIPDFEGTVVSASLKLKLLFSTSLIFGADPVDPTKKDPVETFQLGAVPYDPIGLVDPGLPPGEVMALFSTFDDTPIAAGKDFLLSDPPPFPSDVEIALDDLGKSFIDFKKGGAATFTGWMPTWSFDSRTGTGGAFLEGSELIFGFSDITGPGGPLVPKPTLTIEYEPVPEPSCLLAFGLLALCRRRQTRTS